MVNKYNRGIAKVNRELAANGNPSARFDVNKLTEFRVTIVAKAGSGEIKLECGTINPKSGTIKGDKAQSYDIQSQDAAVLKVISVFPECQAPLI